MRRALLILLFIVALVQALTTYYVNTASTPAGTGVTNETTGPDRAFASLDEAATVLFASPVVDDLLVECCGAVADGPATIRQWTSAEQYGLTVRANPNHPNGRHPGNWSNAHYRIVSSTGDALTLALSQSIGQRRHVEIEGLQILQTAGGYGFNVSYAGVPDTSDPSIFRDCLIRMGSASSLSGVYLWDGDWEAIHISLYNCVIQRDGGGFLGAGIYQEGGNILRVYNCVVTGFVHGISRGNYTIIARNCAVFNNSGNDFNGTIEVAYCASDDGTGTNSVTPADWADEYENPSYMAEVDYRLKETADQKWAGVGTFFDPKVPPMDILGNMRAAKGPSMGPFEYNTAPTPPVVDVGPVRFRRGWGFGF